MATPTPTATAAGQVVPTWTGPGVGSCASVSPPIAPLGQTCETPFAAGAVSQTLVVSGSDAQQVATPTLVNVTSCVAGATSMAQPLHTRCGMCDHVHGVDPFDPA